MTNPWIAQAAVLKLYPGRLRIEIKERKAFALWQKDGRVYLIAADGTVLETYVPQRFASLPLVVGHGAEHTAQDFLDLLKRYPVIAKSVEASVLVAERRWNLHLKERRRGAVAGARARARAAHAGRSRSRPRNCSRATSSRSICGCPIASRCGSPMPPPRRATEALKAAEKDKKAKRKGSDA